MSSQFCRKCKGNNAGFLDTIWRLCGGKERISAHFWYLFLLTFGRAMSILATTHVLAQEMFMADEKLALLRQAHTLHPHPEGVRDPLFLSGSPFFDPRDLVQVKYELLRRVRVDGYSVAQASSLFALSRPTFYPSLAAWDPPALTALLPPPPTHRHSHKLTEELIAQLRPLAKTMSTPQ